MNHPAELNSTPDTTSLGRLTYERSHRRFSIALTDELKDALKQASGIGLVEMSFYLTLYDFDEDCDRLEHFRNDRRTRSSNRRIDRKVCANVGDLVEAAARETIWPTLGHSQMMRLSVHLTLDRSSGTWVASGDCLVHQFIESASNVAVSLG